METDASYYELFDSHLTKIKGFPGFFARKYHYNTYMDVEDFRQEGLMKVWETLLQQPTCTSSYLQDRIHSAIFAAYKRGKSIDNDYQNKHRRAKPVLVRAIDGDGIPENFIADKKLNPEQMAEGKLMLEKFFGMLSVEERQLVKLKLLGFKHKEICREIGRASSTICRMLKSVRPKFNLLYGLA